MSHRRTFALSLLGLALSSLGCDGLTGLHADDDGCPGTWGCKAVAGPEASAAPDPWPTPPAAAPAESSSEPEAGLSSPRQPWDCGPHFPLCDPWPTPPAAPTPSPEEEIIVGPNGLVNALCNAFNHYGTTFPSLARVVPNFTEPCSGTTVNEHGAILTSSACAPQFWGRGQAYSGTVQVGYVSVTCAGSTPATPVNFTSKIEAVYPALGVMVLCGGVNGSGGTYAQGSWAPPLDLSEPIGPTYLHAFQNLLMTDTGCSIGSWASGVGQHTCDTIASASHEPAAGGGLFNDVGSPNVDRLIAIHLGPGGSGRNAARSLKSLLDAGVFTATTCAPLRSQDRTMRTVAALFVETGGCYFGLEGVDPWDKRRDARLYRGPHPVVAHPPCERFGAMAAGGTRQDGGRAKIAGDDGGCFAAALAAVRDFGGVLEHPAFSAAWRIHGLSPPMRSGGWRRADDLGGWTCTVEQGHYGHRARKNTWIYAVRTARPDLLWGPSAEPAPRLPDWVRRLPKDASPELRAARRAYLDEHAAVTGKVWCCPEMLNKRQRRATPLAFRDLLLGLARSVRP